MQSIIPRSNTIDACALKILSATLGMINTIQCSFEQQEAYKRNKNRKRQVIQPKSQVAISCTGISKLHCIIGKPIISGVVQASAIKYSGAQIASVITG